MDEKLILDGHKLAWHAETVNKWLRGERIVPITIDWALTTQCNYQCIYCYGQFQRINQDKPLSKEVIFRFLDDCAELGVKAISFISDGESACSPHLYDAIQRVHENGMDCAVGTNGYLLKDDKLREILPLLSYLRFNISAADDKSYSYIHGCKPGSFDKVCNTIKKAVAIKEQNQLDVTIGLQMVLMPQLKDQLVPLAKLGKELGVDYLVIKHCGDNEEGSLGIDYEKYFDMKNIIEEAESHSDANYLVKAKWSKILSKGCRNYSKCYGAQFILQVSGSGLVAACGSFFNEKFKKYHLGNIQEKSFKEILKSDSYSRIMEELASGRFDPRIECGTLCLQHKINEYLWNLKKSSVTQVDSCEDEEPDHINFI